MNYCLIDLVIARPFNGLIALSFDRLFACMFVCRSYRVIGWVFDWVVGFLFACLIGRLHVDYVV